MSNLRDHNFIRNFHRIRDTICLNLTPNYVAMYYGQLADGPTRRRQLADV